MHRLCVHLGNVFWLVLVLVGIPTITSIQLGRIRLSSTPEFQMLTLAGLGIGATTNLLGAWLTRGKQRIACWQWNFVHLAALLMFYLVFNGQIHFHWLKNALLWVRKTFY
jgi:hypothetical protein